MRHSEAGKKKNSRSGLLGKHYHLLFFCRLLMKGSAAGESTVYAS
jgi:hypothetical protein